MEHHHPHPHLAGKWNLIQVDHKLLPEPFEFFWKDNSVSFSYGNGHVMDFTLDADHKIKWGAHADTHLGHPTPHEPTEAEVLHALHSSHVFKIEHNKLHLFTAEFGKETMVFTRGNS